VRAKFALLALVAGLSACRAADRPVRIGSKNFSESVLLAEVAAQALEHEGLKVDRRLNLGGTFICHHAMVAGELDLYPEYTGTAFTAILGRKPVSDPALVRREVAQEYQKRWRLIWSPPLGFENTFALIVRGDDARRLGIRTISDLAPHAKNLRPGFGYEFIEREDGFKGLVRAYDLHFARQPAEMDLGLLYPALSSGKVDLIAGNSTDGLIDAIGGVVLEDDRHYFPPYEAAFVVSGKREEKTPAVRRALDRLAGRLSAQAMRAWNRQIDRDKRSPQEVARQILAGL
jgi:glycine betaine/choline ABC-type transport system substrate-binding protein